MTRVFRLAKQYIGAMQLDRLKRLKFRAWRRGFLEADLILGPFVDRYGAALTDEELEILETLLDEPDQDIYGWIVGLKPAPARFETPMLARLREFRHEAHAARAGRAD